MSEVQTGTILVGQAFRCNAIAFFCAIRTGAGGITGPLPLQRRLNPGLA